MMNDKKVIILEGSDAVGKSTLLKHIQNLANGKCHTFHSNYDKHFSKENHRKQHKLIAKYIKQQFDDKHYTGNHTVILDRCYISDMTYGQIGYGSRGTLEQKFSYLDDLFKIIKRDKDIQIIMIYCRPDKSKFDTEAKDELLNQTENDKMQGIYDCTMHSLDMLELFVKYDILYYRYDFNEDSDYKILDDFLEKASFNHIYRVK